MTAFNIEREATIVVLEAEIDYLQELEDKFLECGRRLESCNCRTCRAREKRAFEEYVSELTRLQGVNYE